MSDENLLEDVISDENILKNTDEMQPWDQQPGEKPSEYEAFLIYLHLERDSLDASYRGYYARKFPERWKAAVSNRRESEIEASGAFRDWARKWDWRSRRAEYYNWLNEHVHMELTQRQVKAMIETADLGQKMRRLAAGALEAMSPTVEYIDNALDGREVWVRASVLKPEQVIALANAGVTLERLSFGEPTEITESRQDFTDPEDRADRRRKQLREILDIANTRKQLAEVKPKKQKRIPKKKA